MTIQVFFDQLSLQLGICKVEVKTKKKKGHVRQKREIVARGSLSAAQGELLKLFWDVRNQTIATLGLTGESKLEPEHIRVIRQKAAAINRQKQHDQLVLGHYDRFWAAEDAWDIWQEIFEDFVKELRLETPSTS